MDINSPAIQALIAQYERALDGVGNYIVTLAVLRSKYPELVAVCATAGAQGMREAAAAFDALKDPDIADGAPLRDALAKALNVPLEVFDDEKAIAAAAAAYAATKRQREEPS